MATISSTLKILDGFTAPIRRGMDAMTRMIDTMERLDSASGQAIDPSAFAEMRTEVSAANHELELLQRNIQQTDDAPVRQATASFGGLSKAIVVTNQGLELLQKGWNALSAMGTRADDRISVDARLNLITDENHTAGQLEAQVMEAARRSRGAYESTAALVAKMGRQDYFKGNNAAAVTFAETLNKGLVVSGASAMEADSALLQLSQGLASGVLRGEEFNSIMENAPVVAEMMCASLEVTKGELRSMAEEGQLTTDVVVGSIMQQKDTIDQQFGSMPVTFGQAMTLLENHVSSFMDRLSQPGQAVDILVGKLTELEEWANTVQGTAFFDGLAAGATAAVEMTARLAQAAGSTHLFFMENWPAIEPVFWGLVTAIGVLTAVYLIYKGVTAAITIAEGIKGAAQMFSTGATIAATAAQYGLNTALLACPLTWIVIAVVAVIAAIVMLVLWVRNLWQTNIDFKVGVIRIWNGILGFFDQVPIFFMGIGYGIADGFSYAKVTVLQILEAMVNGAIERINQLIGLANKIPGVSIGMIEQVSFGAEAAVEEQAHRAERAAKLAGTKSEAAAKAAERQQQLNEDERQWRAESAAKEQAKREQQVDKSVQPFSDAYEFPPFEVSGGKLDKVGKIGSEVDISNQSITYLRDIAEIQALQRVNDDTSVSYDTAQQYENSYYAEGKMSLNPEDADLLRSPIGVEHTLRMAYEEQEESGEVHLSQMDADLLRQGTGGDTNIYYLSYSGGVRIRNNVQQGENWEEIRKSIYDEAEADIETGLSGIEEAVFG